MLDRVLERVRVVVHRVQAPLVAGVRVRGVQDPVDHRVAHVDVPGRHVDLRPQRARAVGKLAGPHTPEEVHAFGRRSVAVRARTPRLGERAAPLAHLIGGAVAHVCLALADQLLAPRVHLLEVVRGEVEAGPLEPEPAHVGLDRVDILLLLLRGVGVVEAQVALAAELRGDPEVEADRLGVADVEVAVGLRREPGDDRGVLPALEVADDDLADEVLVDCGLVARHALTPLPTALMAASAPSAPVALRRPAAGGGGTPRAPTPPSSRTAGASRPCP